MSEHRPLAFVTGAFSGIGYAPAEQLAQQGFDVAISGSSDRVHESARKLRELGGDAWSHLADAGTYDGVEAFWRFIESLGRPVEVAVLNVGIATAGSFADADEPSETSGLPIDSRSGCAAARLRRMRAGRRAGRRTNRSKRTASETDGTTLGPRTALQTTKPPQKRGFRRWAILGSNQ